jgi:predicted PhzF superfamily epimerase YddE/YHI9
MKTALEQNRADLLSPSFVGTAKDKIAETIQQQSALGISTRYEDRAHDIQIVFNSPEGLSIELTDKVEYDVQVLDHDRVKTIQHVSARYVIVLTPAEVRWRVRVFQAAF